jgi:hypothetical protein
MKCNPRGYEQIIVLSSLNSILYFYNYLFLKDIFI